jgi:serine protease Do
MIGLAPACALAHPRPPAPWGRDALASALTFTVQVEVERSGGSDPFAGGRITPGRAGRVSNDGGGAGFVFDPTGLIATNAHVVEGARSVTVRLHDGRRFPATVVGVDATLDLAVLRISAGEFLPAATLGNSRTLTLGQPVWAIGSPMGYAFSVTSGVVSGRDRLYGAMFPVRLLQHDAALNPGSSGGPLVSRSGEVVGINTATPPETLFDIGVGLAIPIETAAPVLHRLALEGRIERGRLGVSVAPADADVSAALGAASAGLLIDALSDSGAARLAGLAAGDLLTEINGAAVSTPRDLVIALLDTHPGQSVRVTYYRGGQRAQLDALLEGAPATAGAAPRPDAAQAPLDPGMTLGRSDWDGGVSVVSVRPDGPAALYGVRAGDRLRAVNGRAPASADEALALLDLGTARVALLRVERPGEPSRHIVLPLTRAAAAQRPAGRVVDAASGPF